MVVVAVCFACFSAVVSAALPYATRPLLPVCRRQASLQPVRLGEMLLVEPIEEQLSAGTTNLFRSLRRGIRRSVRLMRWSARRWATWMGRAFWFLLVALTAPLVDRALLAAWRDNGWRGVWHFTLLGLALYVRLLLDRRAPLLGKIFLSLALAYGVAYRDLVPDTSFPAGFIDDLLIVILAARGFLLLCPQRLVQEQAVRTARAGARVGLWHHGKMLPPAR
jgi:uncharacterized membrane protein YkvA (DUF1232 family)